MKVLGGGEVDVSVVVMAAKHPIEQQGLVYKVPSQSGNGFYIVSVDDDSPTCTCPDFEERQTRCKHVYAVEYLVRRGVVMAASARTPALSSNPNRRPNTTTC